MADLPVYPWYAVVEDETLEQGDFFYNCPVIIPISQGEAGQLDAEEVIYNVIVLSQSCDLESKKIDLVLVCPFYPIQEFRQRSDYFKSSAGLEALKRGNAPGYHLLNRVDIGGFVQEPVVVDFRNVHSLPICFIVKLAKSTHQRLRLLPPYKEHLSQAFARFFMRVGLPVSVQV